MSTDPLDHFLQADDALHVAADGQMLLASSGRCPPAKVLLCGSFNPIHCGHWQLAKIAEEMLGQLAAFEISVANVDKPPLERNEIRRRITQFHGQASLWLTHAPKFVQKASRFPGVTFVVGADTAERLVSPRYYDGDAGQMLAALKQLGESNCRFLVACRVNAQGLCLGVNDLPIPSSYRDLFQEIPPERFRTDTSSTELRVRERTL